MKVNGAGQWLEDKHGARSRRTWRKLHLVLNADTGEIIAHCLTDQDGDDPSQVKPLLDRIDAEIDQFTADGAYDGGPTYCAVLQHSATARIVIPPRSTAVESDDTGPPGQRDGHITAIANDGRLNWQASTGYGKRALIETAIGRYKGLIGRRLRARSFSAQQTEVAIGCAVRTPGVRSLPGKADIACGIKELIVPNATFVHQRLVARAATGTGYAENEKRGQPIRLHTACVLPAPQPQRAVNLRLAMS